MRREKKKEKVKYRVYLPMLIVTAIAGGVLGVLLALFYNRTWNKLWSPLQIGCIFVMFYLALTIVVLIVSKVNGNADRYFRRSSDYAGIAFMAVMGAVVIFGLGILFEFLYELGIQKQYHEPDSYIFLIDDSGSMGENDGKFRRYDAIEEVLKEKSEEFPYMIYQFTGSVNVARTFGTISQGMGEIDKKNDGGTDMKGALEKLLEDYDNGVWSGSQYPRIIVLTDGQTSGFGMNGVIKSCVDRNITVGTIGLGRGASSRLLKRIALRTGGTFVAIDDVSRLNEAMQEASQKNAKRDLFSERNYVKNEVLYAALRIIFLTILGTLIGGWMYCFSLNGKDAGIIMLCAGVTAVLAAILMEFGMEHLPIASGLIYLLFFVLLGMTPAMAPYTEKRKKAKPQTPKKPSKEKPVKQEETDDTVNRVTEKKKKKNEGIKRIG